MSTRRAAQRRGTPVDNAGTSFGSSSTDPPQPVPPKRPRHNDSTQSVVPINAPSSQAEASVARLAALMESYMVTYPPKAGPRPHHINGDCIPKFDPEDTKQTSEAWLRKVDELSHINEWSEAQTIHYAIAKLEGLARTWYDSLQSLDHTWPRWRAMILEAFPDEFNYPELMEKMLARKKTEKESYVAYYYEKLALLNRLEFEGKKAVAFIVHGIVDPIVKSTAEGGRHTQPESLFKYLSMVTAASQKASGLRGAKTTPKAEVVCHGCGKKGHFQRDCRKQSKSGGGSKPAETSGSQQKDGAGRGGASKPRKSGATERRCFRCNEVGHLRPDCPKNTPNV